MRYHVSLYYGAPLCVEDEHTKLVESVTRALLPALVTMCLAQASNTPLRCKTCHCMNACVWSLVNIQLPLTNAPVSCYPTEATHSQCLVKLAATVGGLHVWGP